MIFSKNLSTMLKYWKFALTEKFCCNDLVSDYKGKNWLCHVIPTWMLVVKTNILSMLELLRVETLLSTLCTIIPQEVAKQPEINLKVRKNTTWFNCFPMLISVSLLRALIFSRRASLEPSSPFKKNCKSRLD